MSGVLIAVLAEAGTTVLAELGESVMVVVVVDVDVVDTEMKPGIGTFGGGAGAVPPVER